ncbi:hypothetical protein CHS0354_036020 [Potamilus streckersoni]|uniref:Uncharacterized protein n=1 Tax=Potamilus streckersoni TaxID=2493646 RepID=A0AAE0VGW7_9BIVA|nr:hypothetical protein CHS0354_036020 [Potamilus streckersoni]
MQNCIFYHVLSESVDKFGIEENLYSRDLIMKGMFIDPEEIKSDVSIMLLGTMHINSGTSSAPPVNNFCVPDLYNKLDADTIEKTRVINSLLTSRLQVQEKVLNKYKHDSERMHTQEKERLTRELKNIGRKLPNYSDIPNLETKIMKIQRRRKCHLRQNYRYSTEPKEIKGISAEREEKPFCDRYHSHHLPTKSTWYKALLPAIQTTIPAPKRERFTLHLKKTNSSCDSEDFVSPKDVVFSAHSLDGALKSSRKLHIADEDSMTV